VNDDPGTITITPPSGGIDCSAGVEAVRFHTYDDHRMAMALSLVGLRRPNVLIEDPKCVAKTYPGYFAELARLFR
jgi:3-phosphoshikimate 1-carboxyvinyltransferase